MKQILRPSIAMMGRLRYPAKFALIGLLFLGPLAVTMYFFQREITTNIDFARNERSGVKYDLPLTRLLHDVLIHQQAACTSQGSLAGGTDIHDSEARIDSDIASVDSIDAELGVALKTASDWTKIKDKIKAVEGLAANSSPRQRLDAHADLVNDLTTFATTVGNNSQLILDPDLDSYYSMDIAITQIPQVVQNVSMARDTAAGIAERRTITNEDRINLAVLAVQTSTPAGTVQSDLQQAIAFNPAVKEKHEQGEKAFQAATSGFLDLVGSRFVKASKIAVSSAEVLQAGNSAIDAAMSYHSDCAGVLDSLLEARMHRFEVRRLSVDLVAVLSVALAGYLFIGFYLSTTESLRALRRTAEVIASGDFNQSVLLNTHDEIGDLTGPLEEMTSSLRGMASIAEQIAHGDLTVRCESRGEQDALGIAFIKMIENLRLLVGALTTSTNSLNDASSKLVSSCSDTEAASRSIANIIREVASAADQSASTSQEMASGSEQAARSATEAADAMERLHAGVTAVLGAGERQQQAALNVDDGMSHALENVAQVTRSSTHMATTSKEAASVAQRGSAAVTKTVESMGRIQEQVKGTSETVTELGSKGQAIGAIVETINQISEQTNLLALNAAIEAARAGDAGRGFAVVADEVRKLAERASQATDEISSLVKSVRSGVEKAVSSMDATRQEVAAGVSRSEEAGTALTQILEVSESVAAEVQGMAKKAQEMASCVESVRESVSELRRAADENEGTVSSMLVEANNVSNAITTLAAVSEQTAAGAEQSSAASQEVAASAQNVSAAVTSQTESIAQVTSAVNELEGLAVHLKSIVGQFHLEDGEPLKDANSGSAKGAEPARSHRPHLRAA